MNQTVRWMMELIRSELTGQDPAPSLFEGMDDGQWNQLYALSKSHDLAHLAGDAAIKHGLLSDGEVKAKFEKQIMTAVFRYQQLQYELDELKRVLNEAKIPFLPLKGSVLRQYYPEPWMRTSCDIDVLVRQENFEQAYEVLVQKGYSQSAHTGHDISFLSNTGVHVELHYSLIEEGRIGKAEQLLDTIWNHAKPLEDSFEYVLDDEMFYYYHLAHMAKHLEGGGGCGIRPFLDLWILNHKTPENVSARKELLMSGGLERFSDVANELTDAWMDDVEPSLLGSQVGNFIISGGVYGSFENSIVIGSGKRKSRFQYLISRIWMPYHRLSEVYPSLKGKRILQPFYEIRRWMKLFKRSTFKRSRAEWKASSAVTDETRNQTAQMLSDLGLI